ncbi:hypothetical protein [Rhodococcus sp. BP22]|uniref:hypothetical protein n=1 Tax=Rhodococcus sp. BP22 TaxID=2758566 RepID=UPI0016479638|nr:hypothetical protein [Rhodococcus sp. BP22]
MFGFYVVMLFVSGIVVIGVVLVASELHPGRRVVNGLIGTAFLGYGIYLAVFFQSGEYRIVIWVFILPFIVLADAMRTVDPTPPHGVYSPDPDAYLVDPDPDAYLVDPDPDPAPARTAATRERIAAAKSAQLEALRAKHAAKSNEFDDHAPSTPA